MEEIKLSQAEITTLLGAIDHALYKGGLRLGDAVNIVPVSLKLRDKLKKPEPAPSPTQQAAEAGKKNG